MAAVVPDLSGKTPEEAAVALKQAGLVLGRTLFTAESKWAELTKPGLVVGQSETPRAQITRGAVVNVVVYKPTVQEFATVPDVLGMTYDEAVTALRGAGLLPGEVTRRHVRDPRLYDVVYRQSPDPGTAAMRWSKVSLGLYGPAEEGFVHVPRLTGLSVADVPAVLIKLGLEQGTVTYEPAPSASLIGTVQAQSPPIGARVKQGTKVDVVVYGK